MNVVPESDVEIGAYRVLDVLGRGATAIVYRVEDDAGRPFALKRLVDEALAEPAGRARFAREMEEAALLEHPNLLSIHATGEHRGVPWYVMDLVEGVTLQEHLETTDLPAPAEAAHILRGVARGLAYLHQRGMVHRDLKPANIFLEGPRREVKLGDYGLLKSTELDDLTAENERIGTPAYMSPEQFKGLKLDARSDVYQLGVLAYRLLTGEVPFTHANFFKLGMLHTTKLPTRPRERNRSVPRELEELVMRCLEKRPRLRYGDAGELEKDLAVFLEPFESGQLAREVAEERMSDSQLSDSQLSSSQSSGERMVAVAMEISDRFQAMLPESAAGDPELATRRRELGLAGIAMAFGGALALHAVSTTPEPRTALLLSLWPTCRGLAALYVDEWAPGWLRTLAGLAAINAATMAVSLLAGAPLEELVMAEGRPAVSGGLAWLVPLRAPYTSMRGLLLPCLGLSLLYASIRSLGKEEGARALRELSEAAACGAAVLALSRAAMVAGRGL